MICIDRERAKVTDAIIEFAASITNSSSSN